MKKVILIAVSALILSACTPAAKSGEADSTAVAVDSAATSVNAGVATETVESVEVVK